MNEEVKDDGLKMADDSGEPSAVNNLSSAEDASTENQTSEIKTMEVHYHPQVKKL